MQDGLLLAFVCTGLTLVKLSPWVLATNLAGKVLGLGSPWGYRCHGLWVGRRASQGTMGRGHQNFGITLGIAVVQVRCLLHAWNGNEGTGALGPGREGAQLMTSWAGGEPGLHLSDFNE